MAERAAEPVPETGPPAGLRGSLGTAGIVFLVVAAASPLVAIGGALPVMMAIGNGAGVPVSYLVVTVVLLLFSVGYAGMSRHVAGGGAFFAYVTAGLGRVTGAGAVGLALLSYTAIQAAVYGLAGAALGGTVAAYGGPDVPWWLWSGVLLSVVAVLGFRSIDVGARVLSVLIVCEVGVLAVLIGAVLWRGGAEGPSAEPFTAGAFLSGSPGIGLMFAVACFIGFEATAIYGEEARDPGRTVPRATYAAVLLIGGFYTLVSWAVVVGVGADRARTAALDDTDGLVFSVAHLYAGPGVAATMEILLLTSLFTALLAFHNTIARYLYAIGRGLLSPLAGTHARHGSPHVASLVQSAAAAVVIAVFALAGADPVLQVFTWMSGMATLGVLALMVLVSVAVVVFFARTGVDTRWWHARIAPVLGTVGLVGVAALALSNFTTLIDGSMGLAALLATLLVAAFAAGAVPVAVRRE
ncbi:APC family permease [Nocardiopsis aegyptia]|uniref:Amino acid transporter n=1 Tax=Nocardiopsis aegyptia TaxID=220378 RepID=A0A7Z0ENF5_9ACTN|nr:APC family permease [Nocardiopsis aegyptia]NYJ35279.1 amino acid transporter [Nocardiopsis aegyptia]